MRRPRILILIAAVAAAALLPASPALGNTAPNPYSPSGASWVTVDPSARVYMEGFGSNWDDYGVFYVPAGTTCTDSGVTATGPFLTANQVDDADCVDSNSVAVDPIDTTTRAGAVPLGFPINFFGTTYTDVYLNTNGGITFDGPNTRYDKSLAALADEAKSSAMYPLGADLYFAAGESNLWTASTTVNGRPAVVFSWENFSNCCTSAPAPEDMSFQLVILNLGGGDFDAWFNFDSVVGFDEGYTAPVALVDLGAGVTPGSNILVANSVSNVSETCTRASSTRLGSPTDTGFASALQGAYFKLESNENRTISVWSDATCETPILPTVQQNTETDRFAYVQLVVSEGSYFSIGSGWSTYNRTTGEIKSTELLFNVDATELADTAANPLIRRSWNTTVPGRFVIGQRGGATVGDPSVPTPAPTPAPTPVTTPAPVAAPQLAETGADPAVTASLGMLAGLLVVGGSLLLAVRRRRGGVSN